MKILKITFQNINSLRGEHSIDFTKTPFTSGSLFAITGPTGSGKSTILDVISLALFNQVPRLGKISRKEIIEKGALLTRNQREAYAAVSYSCSQGDFTSKWSIAINRNNNLNDYEMEISQYGSGEILDCKKSEVPAKNEELIGLNYNQFIKSVVLAQGEFAQFLRAKKDERGELLEKITGTGIYRNLGLRAYDKFREVNRDIKTRRDNIFFLQENLLDEESKTQKSSDLAEKEGLYAPLEAEMKLIEAKIEQKSLISKQKQEIAGLEAKKATEDENLKNFIHKHGEKLSAHEKVQNQAEELREWSRQQETLNNLKAELRHIEQLIADNQLKSGACLEEAKAFTNQEVDAKSIEETLQQFSQKINALQLKRADKLKDYSTLKAQMQRELQAIDFKADEKQPEQDLQTLIQLKESSAEALEQYQQKLTNLNLASLAQEKSRLNHDLEAVYGARQLSEQIRGIEKDLNNLKAEEKEIEKEVQDLPEKITSLKSKEETLKERLQRLQLEKENKELRASLEEHRTQLVDGEPCPLCGAVHHPFASGTAVETSETVAAIKETSKELEGVQKMLAGLESQQKLSFKRIEKIKASSIEREAELNKQKERFTNSFKNYSLQHENGQWDALIQSVKLQLQDLETYDHFEKQLKAIETAIPIQEKLNRVVEEGKTLKAEISQLYTGDDIFRDANRLQQKWTALLQESKSLATQQENLRLKTEKIKTDFKALETSLMQAILAKGFANISEARKALMPDAEYNQLREKREGIQKLLAQFESALTLLKEKLLLLEQKDVPETADELSELLKTKKEKAAELLKSCEDLRRELKNNADNLKKIEAIRAEIADKERKTKRWRLLNELIGDATGKKFNDFAQDLSLSQLLVLANTRLKDLSDRYRIDKPTEAEDDGLVAIDEHMGGQRRSVKTLSGGETFLLSLSLALALSDMASRNVEINSLFIDEGFGTLDLETLDQTLDTLEKLQAESSKTIGIISHVDSLKERIATQIQLKRHGQGYSTLEIV